MRQRAGMSLSGCCHAGNWSPIHRMACREHLQLLFVNLELCNSAIQADSQFWKHPDYRFVETVEALTGIITMFRQ